MNPKKKNGPALRWICAAAGPEKKRVLLLVVIRALQGVEGTLFALQLRQVIDFAAGRQREGFLRHLALLGALVLAAVLLYILGWYWEEKCRTLLEKRFRLRVFTELLLRAYPRVSQVHSGEWMTRITSDTNIVVQAILGILPRLSGMLVQTLSALTALFVLLPQAAYILLPAGAVLVGCSLVLRVKLKAFHTLVQQADGAVRAFLQEHLGGMAVIRAFSREGTTAGRAAGQMDALVDIRMRRNRFTTACIAGVYAAVRFGYLLGVVLCGFLLLDGSMSYGIMAAVLQLIRQVETPLASVSAFVPQYAAMLASAERLMEIEAYPLDCPSAAHSEKEARAYYAGPFAAIGLRDAGFGYADTGSAADDVLQGFSLEIRRGEYVAFTGASGCGKSTVLKLLLGLYPLREGAA